MARDAAATRARILEAATAEFAEHGLAGARVDRIAARAEANKQLLYAHFGSKEGLFDAAVEAHLGALLDEVPFDAHDLPGYAVRLHEFVHHHVDVVRLARWHTLERPGVLAALPEAARSMGAKVEAVAAAQRAGVIDGSLPPEQVLALVVALGQGGAVDDAPAAADPGALDARRAAIRHAVERIIAPT